MDRCVYGVYCGQMCVLTIKVCAPASMDSGRRVGEQVGGLGGVVGRPVGLHCKVGDARRRWSLLLW